ncbi:hypothetical protein Mapa_011671 [Marchantia paleacea]|nr:hypothetical protein Mapa_011671 [Marchantia paleacea]
MYMKFIQELEQLQYKTRDQRLVSMIIPCDNVLYLSDKKQGHNLLKRYPYPQHPVPTAGKVCNSRFTLYSTMKRVQSS